MSVVRGRPPGLAGGMNGSSSRYGSSLSAWPDPKSPTSTRSSSVHIEASQPESPPERRHHNRPALVKPTSTPFQNRLSDMESFTQSFEARLVKGLAQRRVCVDRACDVLQPGAHFEREAESGRKLRNTRAHRVDTKHEMVIGAGGD